MIRTFAFETSEATFETSEANSYKHLYTPRLPKLQGYWLDKGKETPTKWTKARKISLNINPSTIKIQMGLYARSIINFNWNFGNLKSMAGKKRRANTDAIKDAKSRQATRKRNGDPETVQEHDRAETQWQWIDIAEQMGIENNNIWLSGKLSRQLAGKWWSSLLLFEGLTEQVLIGIPNYSLKQFQPNAITSFVTNKNLFLESTVSSKKGKLFAAGCYGTIVELKKQGNVRNFYGQRRTGKVQFVVFMENEKNATFLINSNDLFAPFIKAMARGLFMKIFENIPNADFEETMLAIDYNEYFKEWFAKYNRKSETKNWWEWPKKHKSEQYKDINSI